MDAKIAHVLNNAEIFRYLTGCNKLMTLVEFIGLLKASIDAGKRYISEITSEDVDNYIKTNRKGE